MNTLDFMGFSGDKKEFFSLKNWDIFLGIPSDAIKHGKLENPRTK